LQKIDEETGVLGTVRRYDCCIGAVETAFSTRTLPAKSGRGLFARLIWAPGFADIMKIATAAYQKGSRASCIRGTR